MTKLTTTRVTERLMNRPKVQLGNRPLSNLCLSAINASAAQRTYEKYVVHNEITWSIGTGGTSSRDSPNKWQLGGWPGMRRYGT